MAASGKGLKAYAAELGVNSHTLAGWLRKLRKRAAAELAKSKSTMKPASGDFVDVTREVAAALLGDVGVIEIELGDARIRIESDALAGVLRAVVSSPTSWERCSSRFRSTKRGRRAVFKR